MEELMSLPVWVQALIATCFTYFMTAFGAAFVFVSGKCGERVLNPMQGTAAGIMVAASFFSLLLPAMEKLGSQGADAAFTAAVLSAGFVVGGLFILVSEKILLRFRKFADRGVRSGFLTCFAMTLHNIPEGFAVGVAFGSLTGDYGAWIAAVMLAVGIGVQNFPEGLCVAVPLRRQGFSAAKAFAYGQFSGLVEIAAGVSGAIAVGAVSALLPWALAFSAGAMIAVSCAELIPQCVSEGKTSALLGVTSGFSLMMLLDVLLG